MNNDNRYFYDFVVADLFWKYEAAGGLVRKAGRDSQRKKKKNTIMWRKNKCCRLLSHWRFILHW